MSTNFRLFLSYNPRKHQKTRLIETEIGSKKCRISVELLKTKQLRKTGHLVPTATA